MSEESEEAEEAPTEKGRPVLKATLLVAFAIVPAGSVLIGLPYMLYRRRKQRQSDA